MERTGPTARSADASEHHPQRPYLVPAVNRAIDVLDVLSKGRVLTLSELAAELRIPKTTLFHIMNTLRHRGMVERDPETDRYRAGYRLIHLGSALINNLDVRNVARPIMEALTASVGETTHLGVLDPTDLQVIYVEKIDSPGPIRLATWVGRKNPCYSTAVGKALLMGMPADQLERYLESVELRGYTVNTIQDRDLLREEIARCRSRGYSIDNEEHEPGVRCVGAPVFDRNDEVVAALSIAGPATRITTERLSELGAAVRGAAGRISREMGASEGPPGIPSA
ncbi:IclR family transcriptional regulator [Limnochorda pilosa]|uniref:IclR family transcriptional regulator n=1 Tax=Limnochorda pilosa TaxID=1555112 RepID=A0A0K2SLN4_LIMPI|nr:IclR family transcriptional regulator [Limnochorda pilosa]BAS28015.1 IclR family transcriptional regulator [Limnochorda pilosa]